MNIYRTLNKYLYWLLPILNLEVKRIHPKPHILEMRKLNKKNIIAVEIGVFKGENAYHILKNLNVKKLYLIDPYVTYDGYDDVMNEDLEEAEKYANSLLKKWEDKIVWVKNLSENVVDRIPMADLVYIDGNHSYESCKRDIELYYPKVKKEGMLAGHDFTTNRPEFYGVVPAVIEFAARNNLKLYIDREDWMIIK